jgi:hypothetical protein
VEFSKYFTPIDLATQHENINITKLLLAKNECEIHSLDIDEGKFNKITIFVL